MVVQKLELELEPPRCSSRRRAGAAGAVAAAVLELEPPPPPASVEELSPVGSLWIEGMAKDPGKIEQNGPVFSPGKIG
jgi:hypothetical protein